MAKAKKRKKAAKAKDLALRSGRKVKAGSTVAQVVPLSPNIVAQVTPIAPARRSLEPAGARLRGRAGGTFCAVPGVVADGGVCT